MLLKRMKHKIGYVLLLFVGVSFTACSSDDVVDVVPANCTALMSVDIPRMMEAEKGVDARL